MKRHIRDPHTRKLRELVRLRRLTKPGKAEATRLAFLQAWLSERGRRCPALSNALWYLAHGFDLERRLTFKHAWRSYRMFPTPTKRSLPQEL